MDKPWTIFTFLLIISWIKIENTCSTVSPMFSKIASSNLYLSSFASFLSSFFFAASIGIDTANKQSKIPRYKSKNLMTKAHKTDFDKVISIQKIVLSKLGLEKMKNKDALTFEIHF